MCCTMRRQRLVGGTDIPLRTFSFSVASLQVRLLKTDGFLPSFRSVTFKHA